MQPIISQQFDPVNVLSRMLELAMQTAEAASVDKNHRLVLQAVREVTRLITLITKITRTPVQKPGLQGKPASCPVSQAKTGSQTQKWENCGKIAGKIGVLEEFFKNNLPVNKYQNNSAASAQAASHGKTGKPHDRAAVARGRRIEPATLTAEESLAA